MAVVATIKLEGLETTLRRLRTFPAKVQKKCLRKAVSAGAVPLVKAAKKASPQLRGIFKRSLTTKVKGYQGGAVEVAIVGQSAKIRSAKKVRAGRGGISGRGDVVPIHFIEDGVRPHRIPKEGSKRKLHITLPSGQLVFLYSIQHPGHRGFHPIRHAAETAATEAASRVEQKLAEEIEKLDVGA